MNFLNKKYIKEHIADSEIIFKRGENIFHLGNYFLEKSDYEKNVFNYKIDGNYGEYNIEIGINVDNEIIHSKCSCPYPKKGCKHVVATCLDIREQLIRRKKDSENADNSEEDEAIEYLSFEDIKKEAIDERKRKAKSEHFEITIGDSYKGEHLITTSKGKEYVVTLHNPEEGKAHCTCPDFNTNHLGTCKHIIYLLDKFKNTDEYNKRIKDEIFPFVHIFWDSYQQKPLCFFEKSLDSKLSSELSNYFDKKGSYKLEDIGDLSNLIKEANALQEVRFDEFLLDKVGNALYEREIKKAKSSFKPDYSLIKATLYPYQIEGVEFCLFKRAAIIGDEMGLGKTLQAIALSVFKKRFFGLKKVLVVCPASLKTQWKSEIEKFTDERAIVIAGSKQERQLIYDNNEDFFKITNYEAVLRDTLVIGRFKPDIVILDEAQRIKNFKTKTHQAIKSIPHKQSIVLTGTPLENKLEDLFAIIQFADPEFLGPLWVFASKHFLIAPKKKKRIAGYTNLESLNKKVKSLVIRRKKEDVLESLPEQIINNYYIDLSSEQSKIHRGYLQSLIPLISKKFLTAIDMRRIFEILTGMRMVCNSTYLIDRKTNISPKLVELEKILVDIVIENKRKVVIFSEWTTMTYLIGKALSDLGIDFIEFTGKVPVAKRPALIDEFNNNPDCKVFLSTDAGGLGLNLQVADCVINCELPWNPAKLNQRIGRVIRIGQKSKSVNVINLISKFSIEENVLASINQKQQLFDAIFDGNADTLDFSKTNKTKFINRIRKMLNEELIVPAKEAAPQEELAEETPHFLNPSVLQESEINFYQEEEVDNSVNVAIDKDDESKDTPRFSSSETIEKVLENGMTFLSGIMAMATGKPLITEKDSKSISIDPDTGEVTMKFKLPGYGVK